MVDKHGNDRGEINLDKLNSKYFISGKIDVRKDAVGLDEETSSILEAVKNDENPFPYEMSFQMSELSQSKMIRAGVKTLVEYPFLLDILNEDIGVENL